jgi:hypothetical protein
MAENKPCVRCERIIDANARNCVYCSWTQTQPRPAEIPAVPLEFPYTPPADNRIRNRLFGAVGFIALVIVAFSVGSLVHRADANETSATQTTSRAGSPTSDGSPRTTVVLVPVDVDAVTQNQSPVTSAPAQSPGAASVQSNGERTDATALPSEAYSAAASRARAENAARPNERISIRARSEEVSNQAQAIAHHRHRRAVLTTDWRFIGRALSRFINRCRRCRPIVRPTRG